MMIKRPSPALLLATASFLALTGCQTLQSESFQGLLSLDDKISEFFASGQENEKAAEDDGADLDETPYTEAVISTEDIADAPEEISEEPADETKITAITLPAKTEAKEVGIDAEPVVAEIKAVDVAPKVKPKPKPELDPKRLVNYRSFSGTKKIPAFLRETRVDFDTDGIQPMGVSLRVLRESQPDLKVKQEERNAREGKGETTRILPSLPQNIQLNGSIAEIIDVISARYGYAWSYDRAEGEIVFYRYHDTDYVKTWQFDPEGGRIRNWTVDVTRHITVRDVLVDWCRQTGWKCAWLYEGRANSIKKSDYFRGDFGEAVTKLDRSLGDGNRLQFDIDANARSLTVR